MQDPGNIMSNQMDSVPPVKIYNENFIMDSSEDDIQLSEGEGEPGPGELFTVILSNPFPQRQGFGMEISGGTDRPFIGSDVGIFVNAVKPGGICEKDGRIESGDKIIAVNDVSVEVVTHDEAVKLFVANRSQVKLLLKKSVGLLLRAASGTPTSERSVNSPVSPEIPDSSPRLPADATAESIDGLNMSVGGFLLGLSAGIVAVVLLRRFLTSRT